MSPRRGDSPDPEESVEEVLPARARRRLSGREIDLAGRDKLGAARAAAASGDGTAAAAIAAGAVGSDDPAVAGEAAALLSDPTPTDDHDEL